MKRFSRRQFMRWLGIQLAALGLADVLSACEGRIIEMPPTTLTPGSDSDIGKATHTPTSESHTASPTSEATTIDVLPTSTQAPTNTPQPIATSTPTRSEPSYMAVAHGGEPAPLVRAALQSIGGMGRFVSSGDDVIIKPNVCVNYRSYEYAATTNPWVVRELVEQASSAGAARVRVLDYPFGGSSESAYAVSGIRAQVLAAGGELEAISTFKFIRTDLPDGIDLTSCHIYEDVLNADVVINVPIAKHHSLAGLTLGMKNLMGVILNRPMMHQNLGQRLPDLTSRVRPALTVVDAVRILVRNGPTGGNLADVHKIDHVIASHDIVAADSYAATLFGYDPMDLDYIRAGTAMGLGRSDLQNLDIHDIPLS